jgi:hypothetical protein
MSIDVVLPAGGRLKGAFATEAGAEVKALISLGGETVLARTLRVLRETGRVRRLVVIAPAGVSDPGADVVLPEAATGPDNILLGLRWLQEQEGGASERVLLLTTDLPFLTPRALTDFLDACPAHLDLCAPLVSRAAFEARFPGHDIEFVRLRDGEWTLGCAYLLDPAAIIANQSHIARVFAARKSQLRMARLLGPGFILRFLLRRLAVPDIADRAAQILGCSMAAVPDSPPELAFDIDRPSEYRYARAHQTRAEGEVVP